MSALVRFLPHDVRRPSDRPYTPARKLLGQLALKENSNTISLDKRRAERIITVPGVSALLFCQGREARRQTRTEPVTHSENGLLSLALSGSISLPRNTLQKKDPFPGSLIHSTRYLHPVSHLPIHLSHSPSRRCLQTPVGSSSRYFQGKGERRWDP